MFIEYSAIYKIIAELSIYVYIMFSNFLNRFNIQLDIKWSLPTVILIGWLNKYAIDGIPRWNAIVFYSATFVANALFVQLLLNIVPRIAAKRKIKR